MTAGAVFLAAAYGGSRKIWQYSFLPFRPEVILDRLGGVKQLKEGYRIGEAIVAAEELGFQLFKYIYPYYCEVRAHLIKISG